MNLNVYKRPQFQNGPTYFRKINHIDYYCFGVFCFVVCCCFCLVCVLRQQYITMHKVSRRKHYTKEHQFLQKMFTTTHKRHTARNSHSDREKAVRLAYLHMFKSILTCFTLLNVVSQERECAF